MTWAEWLSVGLNFVSLVVVLLIGLRSIRIGQCADQAARFAADAAAQSVTIASADVRRRQLERVGVLVIALHEIARDAQEVRTDSVQYLPLLDGQAELGLVLAALGRGFPRARKWRQRAAAPLGSRRSKTLGRKRMTR